MDKEIKQGNGIITTINKDAKKRDGSQYFKLVIGKDYYNFFPKQGESTDHIQAMNEGDYVQFEFEQVNSNNKIFRNIMAIRKAQGTPTTKEKADSSEEKDKYDRGMAFNNAAIVVAAMIGAIEDLESAKDTVKDLCNEGWWSELEDHLFERYKAKREGKPIN